MFETIVHQTLQNKNNNAEVEANGPYPTTDLKNSFLGRGYYFWDNHIELAKFWGKIRCNNKFIICEGELKIEKKDFLDLVGSRSDQIHFLNLVSTLNMKKQSIGKTIEALKALEKEEKGIFPYKAIRVMDNLQKRKFPQTQYKFSSKENYSILAPMYIICLLDKNKLILPTFKVIFSN